MTRHGSRLTRLALVLLAACSVATAAGPRLDGSLADHATALVVQPRSVATVAVDGGSLRVSAGSLRVLADRGFAETFLQLDGVRLTPGSRYLVLQGTRPLVAVVADSGGRVNGRFATGAARQGWKGLSPALAERLERPLGALDVVAVSGKAAAGRVAALAKDDPGYFDWTPLCPAEGSPDGARFGEATVSEYQGFSYLSVFGSGVEPLAAVTLRANGVDVGTVTADDFGFVWADASAGTPPGGGDPSTGFPGAMFELPAALLPVSSIAAVELVVGGQAALAGDFASPCVEEPPMPVEAGSVMLCDSSSTWRFGWFDWAIFDDGLEVATFGAFGLDAGAVVEVAVDGVEVGSGTVFDDGSLWLAFSSAPGGEELPLPAEVLPLSGTEEVVASVGGAAVLSGTPDTLCSWPEPVESGSTPLCFGDGGTDPRLAWAEVGWTVYSEGTEELWLWAYGLDAATQVGVTVDGTALGPFGTDDWGYLWVGLSSNPAPGQGTLPDAIRPVAEIDAVTLDLAGAVVAEGSFSEPCQPPLPPVPVSSGWTSLCPLAGGPDVGWGDIGWAVYDNGLEEMWLSAWGFAAGDGVTLTVDGHDLGVFTADEWGGLYLSFSSDPAAGAQLPLPDEIRPLDGMDLVGLAVDGAVALAGSFSQPCTPEPPPEPVATGYTQLCPQGASLASGDVYWAVWEDGLEELSVSAYSLPAGTSLELVVDGASLGTFTTDSWGYLFLSFASEPRWEGQLTLPAEVRPLAEVDVVLLRDAAGAAVVAGSFAEPCSVQPEYQGSTTGLCGGDGTGFGVAGWWTAAVNGQQVAEGVDLMLWPEDAAASFEVVIDGVDVGAPVVQEWWPGTLVLSLGTLAPLPVPPELEPVSAIDVVQVLGADGAVVYQGSFSNPCARQYDEPMPFAAVANTLQRSVRKAVR